MRKIENLSGLVTIRLITVKDVIRKWYYVTAEVHGHIVEENEYRKMSLARYKIKLLVNKYSVRNIVEVLDESNIVLEIKLTADYFSSNRGAKYKEVSENDWE